MTQLPESDELDIATLSAVFQNTTNSYKFYWFLVILDSLKENGDQVIPIKDIAFRMLEKAWYSLDYYKLSLGAQDGFKDIVKDIRSKVEIDNSINSPSLLNQLTQQLSVNELSELEKWITEKLIRWVPFRFIRPFFEVETKRLPDHKVNSTVEKLSNDLFYIRPGSVVYRISTDAIELNPIWVQYFQKHQSILRGFIYWHLVRFVQKNNPNVIGLNEKFGKPLKRDLNLANRFWKGFLVENSDSTCIYSGEPVTSQNLSLDHFLPWSYVAHDQLWNIIPTSKSINSSKGNSLPSFDLYFDKFSDLHYQAVQFYLQKQNSKSKILEDYELILLGKELRNLSREEFCVELKKQFLPLLLTAQNMGFGSYIYTKPTHKKDERNT